MVFRVSTIAARVPATASTKRRVSVATPERCWRRFKTTRSPARIAAADSGDPDGRGLDAGRRALGQQHLDAQRGIDQTHRRAAPGRGPPRCRAPRVEMVAAPAVRGGARPRS